MKFQVWESDNDRPMFIRYAERDGRILFYACDAQGHDLNGGFLMAIRPDGTFELAFGVNPELGFKLDLNGRVIVKGLNG